MIEKISSRLFDLYLIALCIYLVVRAVMYLYERYEFRIVVEPLGPTDPAVFIEHDIIQEAREILRGTNDDTA